jgi:Autographiviridae endonuclease VII
MACINPDCDSEKIFARGLCQACYYRERRNGSLERKNVRNTGKCSVEGCERPALAKNLCNHHYGVQRGDTYNLWKIFRSRNPGDYPAAWDRFDTFLLDMGERPSIRHQLKRHDGGQPFSRSNAYWREPVTAEKGNGTRERNPDYDREWQLRRKYNISKAEEDAILAAQGGVCAGCGTDVMHRHRLSGRRVSMHIDHCHLTNRIRGILCGKCNRAIGLLSDDPALLRRLADYLEK